MGLKITKSLLLVQGASHQPDRKNSAKRDVSRLKKTARLTWCDALPHDTFGRGANDVMKRLKARKAEVLEKK